MKKLTVQDVLYMQKEVIRFNSLMGNSIDNKGLIDTYKFLTKEECLGDGELLDSYRKGDKEGTLDGLIDMVFVSFYFALLEGHKLQDDEYLDRQVNIETNMTTLSNDLLDIEKLVQDGLSFYTRNTLVRILSKGEVAFQYDIMGAFNNILESNLSKLVVKGTVDPYEEMDKILAKGRYSVLSVEEVENEGIVYLAFKALHDSQNDVTFSEPKLIKTSLFKEPELGQFIL